MASPLITWVSKDLKDAYLKGDWDKIKRAKDATKSDLEPFAVSIEKNHIHAFNTFKDSHGRKSQEDAAVRQAAVATNPAGDHKNLSYNPSVFVGTYAKNGGQAFVSKQWWIETIPTAVAIILVGGTALITGKFIVRSLTGRAAANAKLTQLLLDEDKARQVLDFANRDQNAARIAAAEVEVEKAVAARNAALASEDMIGGLVGDFLSVLAKYPRISAALGGGLIALAVTFVIEALSALAIKDFYIELELRNYDSHDWKVKEYYHDNGIIAGGGDFVALTVPGVSEIVSSSSGDWPVDNPPTVQMAAMSSVTYIFQNSKPVLDGLGIALSLVQEDEKSKGFCLGYEVHATRENQLMLRGEPKDDIGAFYKDSQN